jgi:hypothetical protein
MRAQSILDSGALLWLVVLLGVALRLRDYAANRSLWLDESFLALDIIERSMHNLLTGALDFNQTAPAGFLFTEKVAVDAFDKGEYTLRALPLVFGIVGLLLYPLLSRRVLGPAGAIIAVALFAVAGPLVYYSSELKPYSGDIAATIAISLMALAALDDRLSIRRALALGLLGLVLIQLTYAGILAAVGTGAALVAIFAVDRRLAHPGPVIALVGTWAVGAVIFLFSRPGLETQQFTRGAGRLGRFAPLPVSRADLTWYSDRAKDVFGDANFALTRWPLFLVTFLAIVGSVNLVARNWRVFAILVAPVIATVAASAAHKYPLLARSMLFFVPLLFLLVTNGILVLARRLPRAVGATAAALVLAALLAQVSSGGVYQIGQPFRRSEIKDSLTYIARHWRAGDVLYVHYSSQYAFGYYSECACFRLPGNRTLQSIWPVRRIFVHKKSAQFPRAFVPEGPSVIVGTRRPVSSSGRLPFYARDASLIARNRRAWILVTFVVGTREPNLIEYELLRPLDRRGRRVATLLRHGTRLYLYEFPTR